MERIPREYDIRDIDFLFYTPSSETADETTFWALVRLDKLDIPIIRSVIQEIIIQELGVDLENYKVFVRGAEDIEGGTWRYKISIRGILPLNIELLYGKSLNLRDKKLLYDFWLSQLFAFLSRLYYNYHEPYVDYISPTLDIVLSGIIQPPKKCIYIRLL
jgi:hypothetical protein